MSGLQDLVHVQRPARGGRPALLLLHGRGGTEGDLLGVARAIDEGLGALAPRGPEPQPPGYAWFRHLRIGVPEIASLRECLALVGGWLEAAMRVYGIAGPVDAVGFSNGGMMAGALAAARPDLVGGAVLLSSGYPLPEEVSAQGGLAGARILIAGGDDDPFHPLETMRRGAAAYAAAGAEVEVHVTPGAGHGITQDQIDRARAWLGREPGTPEA
jgi:phospholipase/carboxylesterase